jgi:hypothetical protein
MKNYILILSLFLFPFTLFGQSDFYNYIPNYDSIEFETLKDIGFYFNQTDLVENRIDTLYSTSVLIRTIDDGKVLEKRDNLITFYEYDNLLVFRSNPNIEKEIMFLNFLYEEGTIYTISKIFLTDNGDRIKIEYQIENGIDKKLSHIMIYSKNKIECKITFL